MMDNGKKKKKNRINRGFIYSRFLPSSFFRSRFFLCLNAVVGRLSHFIQIWKNLSQLPASKCEERRLIDQFRRKEKKMKHVSHLIKEAWVPRSRNCLLPFSPSTRSSYFPSLSFYHFSISSHSNLCFPSVLVPLKLFPLQFTLFSSPHSPIYLDRCSGYSLHQRKRTIVRGL